MATLEDRLIAGLEAQDWRETASRGPWRRWAKFGRGAMYVISRPGFYRGSHLWEGLWFSEIHQAEPVHAVVGPILDQLLAAGDKLLAQSRPDTEGMLIELMYKGEEK